MAIIFLGAAGAAIVKLRCPACAHIDVRARRPAGESYECRNCGERFTQEQGTAPSDDGRR